MLLSIVECSDYRKFGQESPLPLRKIVNSDVEIIGPVLEKNVAAMRNRGAQMAQGQWVFFKDMDCGVSIDNVLDLIKEQPAVSAIGGLYKTRRSNYLGRAYHKIQNQWVMQGMDFIQKDRHLLGGALLLKKQAFDEMGGFNQVIGWGGEETEFVSRLIKKGFKTQVDYRLEVVHDKNMSWKAFLKRAWFQNFNHSYYNISPKGVSSSLNYLKVSPFYLFPIVVFFITGWVARLTGSFCRWIKGRWPWS